MHRHRPPHVVLAAWIVTGPLGHLYAGVADWAGVLVRFVRARALGSDVARAAGARARRDAAAARPHSPKRFSSERKMFTIETKIPVAIHTASSAVPCLRR